jgi:hypothetical protein
MTMKLLVELLMTEENKFIKDFPKRKFKVIEFPGDVMNETKGNLNNKKKLLT